MRPLVARQGRLRAPFLTPDQVPNAHGQSLQLKGFAQNLNIGAQLAVASSGVAGVTGNEESGERWLQRARCFGESPPIHATGQADIGHQQVNSRLPDRALQRGHAAMGFPPRSRAV